MATAAAAAPPIVTFYRLIEEVRPPVRADRSAMGSLPTRAYRHCEAVSSASGFGWYLHAPLDMELLWDGAQIWWRCDGLDSWMPIGAAQYPHFAARFAEAAPDEVKDYPPPLVTALQEPGIVQVWTGLAARTAPGWSLLVRPLANLPRHPGFEAYEGIVEADRWFGPIFSNLRLTRTDVPIRLRADEAFLQVQPIPQMAYADAALNGAGLVPDLAALAPEDWQAYERAIVAPNRDPDHQPGAYAAEARRRRRASPDAPAIPAGCPMRAAMTAAASRAAAAGSATAA
jgi:Family of unknown function (DUF6065)